MKKRIVITGMGIVNPLGIGIENFWKNVMDEQCGINYIKLFDTKNYPIKLAGQIDIDTYDYLPKRLVNKTDKFTQYALISSDMALEDSNIDITKEDEYKIGIFYGNNSGGWDICERGFKELYSEGAEFVNPWQATAWFPAAAQGYISIKNKIKGHSKTFIADRVSGAAATYFAACSILSGRNNVVVVGGTEAPITPFGICCYFENGEMSTAKKLDFAGIAFDSNSEGIILSEGSASLIFEEYEHAKARNAPIYGELKGFCMCSDYNENVVKKYENMLDSSGNSISDINLIIPEGNASKTCDDFEINFINELCRKRKEKMPVIFPKSYYGHLYGGATPTDIIFSLLSMKNKEIPLFSKIKNRDFKNFRVPNESLEINKVLVNSRSRDGVNVGFILENFQN